MKHEADTRHAAPFILVTGGKGGVGKTTVAANLGVQLARDGRRTLLVDLDLGLANLDIALGLSASATLEDAVRGRAELRDCVAEGPGGVHVLVGCSGDEGLGRLGGSERKALLRELSILSQGYEIVVGDSAAGIGPDVMDFARAADRVLVVTTPQVPALTDAYGLIKALDQFGCRTDGDIPTPEIIVNLSSGVEEGRAIAHKLRAVCERFLARSPRQAGWIPRSRMIERSARDQRPFALGREEALERLCVRQITTRLGRLCRRPGLDGSGLKAPVQHVR